MDQMNSIDGVRLTPLKTFTGDRGEVLHAMRDGDPGCGPFGEAYFSTVHRGAVKAWKRHRRMTSNLVVPAGEIRIVIVGRRDAGPGAPSFMDVCLSRRNYQRLTIPPGLWMGFQGLGPGLNLLLNIASLPHDDNECDELPSDSELIGYRWSDGR